MAGKRDKSAQGPYADKFRQQLESSLGRLQERTGFEVLPKHRIIPEKMTFREWCEQLGRDGLKVDGHPFTLANRPAMAWIYDQIPSTIEEAYGRVLVLMKCAQVGFTVMEMLAAIYFGLKFEPCKVGLFLPDMKLAGAKSTERFMPIMRTVPVAYERLTVEGAAGERKKGEGNVLIRSMGDSRFHFLWTSGKAMTESFPMDVLTLDEVQEMPLEQIEKASERLSASRIKYRLMGSTANWPDSDIHWWFKQGTQHDFWTICPHCEAAHVLDQVFPDCIKLDVERDDYRYVCVACGGWLDDPQAGEWRAGNPDARLTSIHFSQLLSPTVSAREIIEKWQHAESMKNFSNRVLGKPYTDPSQIPITLEMLNDCAAEGRALGLVWKATAKHTFMGIDQMGRFNVAILKERLPDGRQAVIHVEEIYGDDPFARCDELMIEYGVDVCCVETLPNYNDAKRFAGRHLGRVFLAGYADMPEDMLRWGDAVITKADRKMDESERDRYVVTLNQYKCMQVAMARIAKRQCLFPDPAALTQEIEEKGQRRIIAVLRDRVFLHLTKTALISEKDEEQKKYKTKVVKVGIDPHFSYANMLCDVAWARAHGTASFILPPPATERAPMASVRATLERRMPGLPPHVLEMVDESPAGTVCGRCVAYGDRGSWCNERHMIVRSQDPGCPLFIPC